MTRRERLERKAEKRREWAEGRRRESDQRFETARRDTSVIPPGQPILIGHHSERGHRAHLKRIDNNMRKGCEASDMAQHHESKAAGIERQLETSIFSDDADAIEQLEAKIEKLEAERTQNNAINKIIRKKPKYKPTPEKIAELEDLGYSENLAAKLFEPDCCGRIGIAEYVNQNLGGRIKNARDRIQQIKNRNKRTEIAEQRGGVFIEGEDYIFVTFAEKPEREILTALKAAGFHWSSGHWCGYRKDLPECVAELANFPASTKLSNQITKGLI